MTENHERWNDDVAAYMLGALDPAEAAELERHLEGCERCRERVRWLEPAVRMLPEEVERVEPPAPLRERVMAEVRADAAAASAAAGTTEREARSERKSPGWLRRLGGGALGWRPVVGLAVMVLALVAVAGYEIGNGGDEGGGPAQTFTAGKAPGVTAEMVAEGDGEGGTLQLANVHQLPEDQVLEAWVQRDGEVEPVPALFVPDREGNASTMIESMDGVEVVMVTYEPKGGSDAPTSKPIVTVPIQ
ncbi:MAG TPA: anti-sigma factor [Solirubrobacterales bacterium]|nr:anti-sigma factor [Solirubrobacterales bacterium]